MQDMKQLLEMGAITDIFIIELGKYAEKAEKAEATNTRNEFLKEKSGHFGRSYRKHRRDNKYYT